MFLKSHSPTAAYVGVVMAQISSTHRPKECDPQIALSYQHSICFT